MTYSHPLQQLLSSFLESLQDNNQVAVLDSDKMSLESDLGAETGVCELEEQVATPSRRNRRYYFDKRRARPAWECRRIRSRWAR